MSQQRKTILQQQRISDVSDSLRHFSTENPEIIPIVLVPEERSVLSCWMSVPTGPHSIMHKCGKDFTPNELAAAGLQCLPGWYNVAYVVTGNACNYNAPIKSCPTADNVMVDCDLTLIFEIGPDPVEVKKFCYKMGARRFDEFLNAAVEEAVRHLIRGCMHTDVYELKGSNDLRVVETLAELNRKFNTFGIHFSSMAITDVKFKKELQDTLQQTTEFKSKIQEQSKKQKNLMDQIEFRKNREVQELEQSNRRIIQDLQAQRTRVEIDREKSHVECVSQAEVAITRARQEANVDQVQATSEKHVAKSNGRAIAEKILADIKALDNSTRIKVEQQCKNDIYESLNKKDAAANLAKALETEAEAEEHAASALKIKREHELRMAKLEVLQLIANNNKIVISGEQGEKLINEFLDSGILNNIELAD